MPNDPEFTQRNIGDPSARPNPDSRSAMNDLASRIRGNTAGQPSATPVPIAANTNPGIAKTSFSASGVPIAGRAAVQPLAMNTHATKTGGVKPRRLTTKMILMIVGIGVLIAISLAVYLLLTNRKPKAEDLIFTVTAPREVKAGGDVEIVVNYTNNSNRALTKVLVETEFSSGFELTKSSVPSTGVKNNQFPMSDLSPKSQDRIVLNGRLFGDADNAVPLRAKITFVPEGYSFTLTADAESPVTIKAPSMTLDFTVPNSLHGGSTVTYDAQISNGGDHPITNIQAAFSFPDGFAFGSSDPALKDSKLLIDTLDAGATKHIIVKGTLAGNEGDQKTVKLALSLLDTSGKAYTQVENEKITVISAPTLSVTQSASAEKIGPGDSVTFAITVKNIGTAALSNLVLSTTIDTNVLNPGSINISNNGVYQEKDKKVVWDNTVVEGLKLLEPNKEIQVSVSLASTPDISVSGKEFTIASKPQVQSGDKVVAGNANTVKIRTAVDFAVSRSPFDANGAPVGSGPTSPQIGKTTTYRVTWKVRNRYNDVHAARVAAVIPLGATWVGNDSVTQGAHLAYDPVQKTVIWDIGNLFAATANPVGSEATATFDVSVTPSADQKAKPIPLVTNIKFTGQDTFSIEDIAIIRDSLLADEVE